MNRLVAGIVLAGLFMIPLIGRTAEPGAQTPAERAAAAVAKADAALQKGLGTLAKAQTAAAAATANLDKAKADLQAAEASGDKEKIKAARKAEAEAKWLANDAALRLKRMTDMVDRLKAIVEQTKAAADKVALAKTPAEANQMARLAEMKAAMAARIELSLESMMQPRPRQEIINVTIPSTTTSTTRPTLTPVGDLP